MPHKPYIAIAEAESVPPGKFSRVVVEERPYVLANVDGRFYAVEDNCSHEDYPLSYGCLDGGRIKCSLHGSRFNLATGAPIEEPAETPIRTYRAMVAEGLVWIDPTSPANA
jgi:3-phenylpropionate/trans-cinnamate dioxygenase ferredoxin component